MNKLSTPTNHDQWQEYEETLLAFEAAWLATPSPDIGDFLPDANDEGYSYLLAELIKIDLEYRWRRGDEKTVEDYSEQFPDLNRDGEWPMALVREELRVRKAANKLPPADVLRARFPAQADELLHLFGSAERSASESSRADDQAAASTLASGPVKSSDSGIGPATLRELGRYEILRRVGRGSFARVYQARDPQLHRDVAIKLPRAGVVDVPDLHERFLREARAAASLNHPGIIPIFEVGEADGCPYIVSEFVDGSLEELLKQSEPDTSQAVEWLIQIAEAVHYAHQCGVVHRDLKPANIMVTKQGELRLTDFGLAHQADSGATLTRDGDIVGTPAYMSPEQARGEGHSVDGRSDVYSLGVLMYRLLTGRLPFEGRSASVLHRVLHDPPPTPRSVQRDTPRDLETSCLKCLSKEPEERYQSVHDFAQDLRRFQVGEPILARRATLAERAWKWSRRHPALATATVVVAALVGVLSGLWIHLQAVSLDRDRAVAAEVRAKQAEQDRTADLARSYAQAGVLAFQRGQARESIRLLDRSMEMGHHDTIDLTFRKVEAQVVQRNVTEARALITSIAADSDLGEHTGRALVWRAVFAEADDAKSLFTAALEQQLSDADRQYTLGMLAPTTSTAIEHFGRAIDADPFHHRARTTSLNLRVISGQLGQARFELNGNRQLFPDDPYLDLLEGVLSTLEGDGSAASTYLQHAQVSEERRHAWASFSQLAASVVNRLQDPSAIDRQFAPFLKQQIPSNAAVMRTLVDSGLQLPIRLGSELKELGASLASNDLAELKGRLAKLVEIHPEGSLLYALGELHLSDDEYEAARDVFLKARETPSIAAGHQMRCDLGIIGTTVMLGLIQEQDVERNKQLALESVRRLDSNLPFPAARCKLFAQVGITTGDVVLTRIWMEKWESHSGVDRSDLLLHKVELELMDRRYDAALAACDEYLKLVPDNEYVQSQRRLALGCLNEALGNTASSVDVASEDRPDN